ncbi:MAG: YicC family protein [Planctomycetaceae bacterium]
MALSMTGCGDAVGHDGPTTCRVEVRVVNNRFLKFALRTRDGHAALESSIEAAVRARLRRGTVQVTLEIDGPLAAARRRLDLGQLAAYLDDWERFCAQRDLPMPRAVDGLLTLPGILVEQWPAADALESLWPLVSATLARALDGVDAMRRREGTAMAADLAAGCDEIRGLAAGIAARSGELIEEHRQRLHERVSRALAGLGVTLGEADVAREVALLADRSDIAEELVRLDSHLRQFRRLLDDDSPGRQLDFLAQELAREANTIGSKSADVGVAHAVVEIKTRVERLRELVQNLE